MTITTAGDVEVHSSPHLVLFHGTGSPPPAPVATVSVSSADRFAEMRSRVGPDIDEDATGPDTAMPGWVVARDILLAFNEIGGALDPVPGGPFDYGDTSIFVPEGADGIIYLLVQLVPWDISIDYQPTLPLPSGNVFLRTLANVSRGTGANAAVTIRQRCFGVITIPSMEVGAGIDGLF